MQSVQVVPPSVEPSQGNSHPTQRGPCARTSAPDPQPRSDRAGELTLPNNRCSVDSPRLDCRSGNGSNSETPIPKPPSAVQNPCTQATLKTVREVACPACLIPRRGCLQRQARLNHALHFPGLRAIGSTEERSAKAVRRNPVHAVLLWKPIRQVTADTGDSDAPVAPG